MPLSLAQRRATLGLAVIGNVLPIGVATATDFGSHRPVFFAGAAVACVAPIVVTSVSRRRHPLVFRTAAYSGIPALTALQAFSGGVASGYSVLSLMAMIWFGLRTTDRELYAALALLAVCAYGPMLVVGAPAYPVSWGHATLLLLIGATVAGSLRYGVREMQRLHRRLRTQAVGDELTGLLNRRGRREETGRVLARAKRDGTEVALLILDGLKATNHTRGHDEGDRLLSGTAERLRAELREGDVLARLGGDEFGALHPGATPASALEAAQRLARRTPRAGAFSCGVAIWDGRETIDELTRRADLTLYEVKATGGGRALAAPAPADADRLPV